MQVSILSNVLYLRLDRKDRVCGVFEVLQRVRNSYWWRLIQVVIGSYSRKTVSGYEKGNGNELFCIKEVLSDWDHNFWWSL